MKWPNMNLDVIIYTKMHKGNLSKTIKRIFSVKGGRGGAPLFRYKEKLQKYFPLRGGGGEYPQFR